MAIDVLAWAMCEAYARNGGNNFAEHFNTRAAKIWMRQALEEVGVAELIAADKEYDEAHAEFYAVAMDRETANDRYMRQGRYITARKRRAAALARVSGGAA